MSVALAAAVAAPVIMNMIANDKASGSDSAATAMMQRALREVSQIQIPEQRLLKLEELKSAGVITPELEQAYMQEDSELKGIALDPQMRDAQMGALGKLQDISEQGGLSLQDRSRLNQVLGDFNAANRGQQQAIKQGFARRGMSGGGAELASALQAQQNAASNASQQSLGVEAMAQQRALDAIMQAGQMGGNIRSQDFAEQAKIAEAQDLINRFNVANRQDVGARNIGSRNAAQAANLQNQQNIMNTNVGLRNQGQMYNIEAGQRDFANRMTKASPMTQGMQNMAGMYGQQAQATRDMWGGIGQGVGQGLGSYANYQQNQDYLNKKYPSSAQTSKVKEVHWMPEGTTDSYEDAWLPWDTTKK